MNQVVFESPSVRVTLLMGGRLISAAGMNLPICTVALIEQRGRRLLVDTGYPNHTRQLFERLGHLGLGAEDVDQIVLTHLHWDHVLNITRFPRAQIFLHEREWSTNHANPEDYARVDALRAYLESRQPVLVSEPCYPLGEEVRLWHSPGHTAGSISVQVGPLVLSGDAIPHRAAARRGVPDLIFGDPEQARATVQQLLSMASIIVPGHGSPFPAASVRGISNGGNPHD